MTLKRVAISIPTGRSAIKEWTFNNVHLYVNVLADLLSNFIFVKNFTLFITDNVCDNTVCIHDI